MSIHECDPPDPLVGDLRSWMCPDCGRRHEKVFPRFEFLREPHQRADWIAEPLA